MNAIDKIRERDSLIHTFQVRIAELEAQLAEANARAEAAYREIENLSKIIFTASEGKQEAVYEYWQDCDFNKTHKRAEKVEADARIAELEARAEAAEQRLVLSEARERAAWENDAEWKRNFKALCQQTDQRESEMSDQFTLLDKARLEAEARAEAAEKESQRMMDVNRALMDKYALHDEEAWAFLPEDVGVAEYIPALQSRLTAAEAGAQREKQRAETLFHACLERENAKLAAEAEAARLRAWMDGLATDLQARETDFDLCRMSDHMQALCGCRDLAEAIRAALAPAEAHE